MNFPFKMIDLTHPLSSEIPSWNGSSAFDLIDEEYIKMLTSAGTHVDAPSYFFPNGNSIDKLSLEQLCGPACILDVSSKAEETYEISPSDIESFEKTYGPIPPNSIVVGYTGWGRHWQNPQSYRNATAGGKMQFPTFTLSSIECLVDKNIAGIAIDTLAIESLQSNFPCHKLLLSKGIYIVENIANISELPPTGSFILTLPLKIKKGFEAPARTIGLIYQ